MNVGECWLVVGASVCPWATVATHRAHHQQCVMVICLINGCNVKCFRALKSTTSGSRMEPCYQHKASRLQHPLVSWEFKKKVPRRSGSFLVFTFLHTRSFWLPFNAGKFVCWCHHSSVISHTTNWTDFSSECLHLNWCISSVFGRAGIETLESAVAFGRDCTQSWPNVGPCCACGARKYLFHPKIYPPCWYNFVWQWKCWNTGQCWTNVFPSHFCTVTDGHIFTEFLQVDQNVHQWTPRLKIKAQINFDATIATDMFQLRQTWRFYSHFEHQRSNLVGAPLRLAAHEMINAF